MIEFWQFVWILILVQMAIGLWLTFRLYPGKRDGDSGSRGGEAT